MTVSYWLRLDHVRTDVGNLAYKVPVLYLYAVILT